MSTRETLGHLALPTSFNNNNNNNNRRAGIERELASRADQRILRIEMVCTSGKIHRQDAA